MTDDQVQTIRAALVASEGQSVDERTAAVSDALNFKPTPRGGGVVWFILVGGLILLLALAICGLIFAEKDDKMIRVVTTLLAGLLGLFVKSPVQSG